MTQPGQRASPPGITVMLFLAGCALLGWLGVGPSAQGAEPLRWRWSNPRPHGANIVDMAYSDSLGLGVQVAELGQIFSSVDLNLWIPRESGVTNDLRAVAFFPLFTGQRILVTGVNGMVLYADDVDDFRLGSISPATTDWLEAVAASFSIAVAVGDNGAVFTSTDGANWRRQSSGTSQWLRGVTLGGGIFVAVGENGKIITSLNGTNWTSRSSGTTAHLNRVAFANGRFTAVAEGGSGRFSTNGAITWFAEPIGATNDLFDAIGVNGTRLVVGDSEVRSQQTGASWLDELTQSNGPTPWTYYSNVKPPDYFLVAGRTGLMEEGRFGTNGTPFAWAPGDQSLRQWLWDVTCPTNLYVAVGDRASILTSGNGVDWRLELVPPAVTNAIFLGIGGTTNMLVTVGSEGSLIISPNVVSNYSVTNIVGTNVVVTNGTSSSFGVLWYAMNAGTSNDLQGIGASSELLVASGAGGTIVTSSDGTNWSSQISPTIKFLSGVTAWPGGWVLTGDDGAMVTSAKGKDWDLIPPLTTNWLYRVRYVGGRLIAVGQNGTIFTSTNGANWTKQTSGTTKWLNDVTFVNGKWFIVGNSGTVLESTNGVNWSGIGTRTRKNLYAATTDSRQMVAVGIEGVILRAQIVPDLTPVSVLAFDRINTNFGSWSLAQNIYLFGGRADQRFTLDYRAAFDTNIWAAGPQLEFFDGSGTLFYLESVTSTNPLPREFYRATLVVP